MQNPLSAATKVALEEIVQKHLNQSKYGYFLMADDLSELVDELSGFFETSRSIQTVGRKFLLKQSTESEQQITRDKRSK